MRIVYVLTSLGIGGAERQALLLANRMELRGHEVRLVVLRRRLAEEWPCHLERSYLEMRRSPGSAFKGLICAWKALRDFKPDIIHSHSFHANVFARLLGVLSRGAVHVSTVHNVYEGDWRRMLVYRLTDRLSWRTVAVSAAARERFARLKAVPAAKCMEIANGFDLTEFSPEPERRRRMRTAMEVEGEFVWLNAGRLVEAKDLPNLLRAFAAVHAARHDARLWIAAETVGPVYASAQALIQESGIEAAVRWLGLCREMPLLLDAADGFVLSSAWEGMPLAVGEAMAMEKPVVATDVGGVRELAADAAMIVAAKDTGALAAAMLALMEAQPAARAELGRKARMRIETGFNINATVDAWERLYCDGVQSGRTQ